MSLCVAWFLGVVFHFVAFWFGSGRFSCGVVAFVMLCVVLFCCCVCFFVLLDVD